MTKREFVLGCAGILLAPLVARAQRTVPLIGVLGARSAKVDAHLLAAFRQGLEAKGYIEGKNLEIAFRWADGRYEGLPVLAAELVRLRPMAIVTTGGSASALSAKSATGSIPIVFSVGGDPVKLGLVRNLGRPDANLTGVTVYSAALDQKRLELLHELVPAAKVIATLINPTNPSGADQLREAHAAAGLLSQRLHVLTAKSEREIDDAFEMLGSLRIEALAVASDSFFISQRQKIIAQAAKRRLPTVYPIREFADAGGLLSYGTDFARMYRVLGEYAGQILRGVPVADLPLQQPTTYELVINLRTARNIGLKIPQTVLARADRVIE